MGNLYYRQYHVGILKDEKELYDRIEKAGTELKIKSKNELIKQLLILGLTTYEKSKGGVDETSNHIKNLFLSSPNNNTVKDSAQEGTIAPKESNSHNDALFDLKKTEEDLLNKLFGDVILIKSMVSSLFEIMRLKVEDPNFADGTEIIPYLFAIGGYSKTPDYLKDLELEFIKRDD